MLNEKMLYQKAEAEVICFDNTDVITASGGSCGTLVGSNCQNNTGYTYPVTRDARTARSSRNSR